MLVARRGNQEETLASRGEVRRDPGRREASAPGDEFDGSEVIVTAPRAAGQHRCREGEREGTRRIRDERARSIGRRRMRREHTVYRVVRLARGTARRRGDDAHDAQAGNGRAPARRRRGTSSSTMELRPARYPRRRYCNRSMAMV